MHEAQATRIERAWAELAAVPSLLPRQIVVRPRSMLGREGWVAVLAIRDTLTVAVPDASYVVKIEASLRGLPSVGITSEALLAQLGASQVLGPADLFYPPAALSPDAPSAVVRVSRTRLDELKGMLEPDDFEESGLEYVDSDVFAVTDTHGRVVAACGYERWPAGIAHLCIATAPQQRRQGAGRRVAQAALASALREGLLPQWRARLEPSKALARSQGLARWGFQLSLRL